MDFKEFKAQLKKLNNLVKNLEEIGSVSALDQAMIKRKIEGLYEVVAADYFERPESKIEESKKEQKTIPDVPSNVDFPSPSAKTEKPSSVEENTEQEEDDKDSVFYFEDSDESEEKEKEEKPKDESSSINTDAEEHSVATPKNEEVNSEFQNETNGTAEKSDYQESQETHVATQSTSTSTELEELFDISRGNELSDRLSATPVNDILKAMGLNERIFTQNELFGGNHTEFKQTIEKLNSLQSFAEAKNYLKSTIAEKYDWADPERKEIATNFIHIIHRRYKNSI